MDTPKCKRTVVTTPWAESLTGGCRVVDHWVIEVVGRVVWGGRQKWLRSRLALAALD